MSLGLASISNAAVAFYYHHVEILEEGEGDLVPIGHYINLSFTGKLFGVDGGGKVFEDSSDGGKHPLAEYFYGKNVFPCFEKAMPQMRVGTVANVICPSTDAFEGKKYGIVEPNSNVLFELKIDEVIPAPESKVDFSVELLNNSFGPQIPDATHFASPDFSVTIEYEANTADGKQLNAKMNVKISEENRHLHSCYAKAFPLLRKGSKAKITCPHTLTKGAMDFHQKIPPFTDTIITVIIQDFTGAGEGDAVVIKRPMVHQDFGVEFIEEGEGELIEEGMIVSVEYDMMNLGKVLHSDKTKLTAGAKVIECVRRALLMLRNKSVAIVTCPPELGFGEKAVKGAVENTELHFKFTVVGLEDKIVPKINYSVETIKEGSGPEVPAGAKVRVKIQAKKIDGEETLEKAEPEFTAGDEENTLPCLGRGLVGLQKGQIAMINCPFDMAFGVDGREGVPPHTDLIFEVEVVDFEGSEPNPENAEAPVEGHPDAEHIEKAEADEAARKAEEL